MKCKCGCGLEVKPGNKYVHGHNSFSRIPKPSTRRKISTSHLGLMPPEATREKIRLANLGNQNAVGPRPKSYGNQNAVGTTRSPEAINKLLESRWATEEAHSKHSNLMRELWGNPFFKDRQVKLVTKGNSARPTRPEQVLIDLISSCGLPWVYNGNNGNIIIDGLCPDFVHKTQPIILLVNGQYWHNDPSWELKVTNRYKSKGFEVITLEDEEIYKSPEGYLLFLLATARASQEFHLVDSLSEPTNLLGKPNAS